MPWGVGSCPPNETDAQLREIARDTHEHVHEHVRSGEMACNACNIICGLAHQSSDSGQPIHVWGEQRSDVLSEHATVTLEPYSDDVSSTLVGVYLPGRRVDTRVPSSSGRFRKVNALEKGAVRRRHTHRILGHLLAQRQTGGVRCLALGGVNMTASYFEERNGACSHASQGARGKGRALCELG